MLGDIQDRLTITVIEGLVMAKIKYSPANSSRNACEAEAGLIVCFGSIVLKNLKSSKTLNFVHRTNRSRITHKIRAELVK